MTRPVRARRVRPWLAVPVAVGLMLTAACTGGRASYSPPFLPIECAIGAQGVTCSISGRIVSPIGTFGLSVDVFHSEQPAGPEGPDPYRLVIRHRVEQGTVDTLYHLDVSSDVQIDGNGRFHVEIGHRAAFVDVSGGSVTAITLREPGAPAPGVESQVPQAESADDTSSEQAQPPTVEALRPPRYSGPRRFNVRGLGTSTYKSDPTYRAKLTAAVQTAEFELWIGIDAVGESDLREPMSSCLHVAGPAGEMVVHPFAMNVHVEQPEHYAGSLRFPLILTGEYEFLYSCTDDYTTVPIGTAAVPNIGVSVYDSTYYAVVLRVRTATAGLVVTFAVVGASDLRTPDSSCLKTSDGDIEATVKLAISRTERNAFYVGTMTFAGARSGQFVYSCADYTPVNVA
jgi:hypothetical protein